MSASSINQMEFENPHSLVKKITKEQFQQVLDLLSNDIKLLLNNQELTEEEAALLLRRTKQLNYIRSEFSWMFNN